MLKTGMIKFPHDGKNLWVISVLLVCIALIAYQAISLRSHSQSVQDRWERYSTQAAELSVALRSVSQAFGYGGFIHHFKNFVLRGDRSYQAQANQRLSELQGALAKLDVLVAIEPRLRAELAVLNDTVAQYGSALNTAIRRSGQVSATELDNLVKVNDTPAVAALTSLSNQLDRYFNANRRQSIAELKNLHRQINQGLIVIAVLVLAAMIVGWQFYNLNLLHREVVETKDQADGLIDHAPEGLIVVNKDGLITRANSRAGKLLEYTRKELEGKSVDELVSAFLRDRHASLRTSFTNDGGRRDMALGRTVKALTKNGKEIDVEVSLNPIAIDGEHHVIVNIRDVTEQTRIAEELRQSKAAADASNKAKSEFLASMSHEIRTPLTGLLGMADALQTTTLTDVQAEFVDTLKNSGLHLEAVLDDILDLSKLEADKIEIQHQRFEPGELTKTIDLSYRANATAKDLLFELKLDTSLDDTILVGDPVRLRQILMNFIGNAIKFTNTGQVTGRLSLERLTEADGELSIVVADTGIGIPKEALTAIFDPFVQVNMQDKTSIKGTGLGGGCRFNLYGPHPDRHRTGTARRGSPSLAAGPGENYCLQHRQSQKNTRRGRQRSEQAPDRGGRR
jgi:PAS domain S-box-containing protein